MFALIRLIGIIHSFSFSNTLWTHKALVHLRLLVFVSVFVSFVFVFVFVISSHSRNQITNITTLCPTSRLLVKTALR